MITYDLDVDSIIINGIKMAPYITNAKFGWHKMWGKGSGRNIAQSVVGSFNIFPKITLTYRRLNQNQLETISSIVNSQEQTSTFYDPELKKTITIATYTNDLEYNQKRIGRVSNFDVAYISRKRRVG